MGRFFKPADEMNPQGYYEDFVSHGLVRSMTAGVLTPIDYMDIMSDLLCADGTDLAVGAWGAKDPWFLQVKPSWQKALTPRLAVMCKRDPDKVVDSWVRMSRLSGREPTAQMIEGYVRITVTRYEALEPLKHVWPDYVELDFDEERSDDWVEETLRDALIETSE